MGGQLSHCFPYEVANNLLGGPRYSWDCKSIWTRGSKKETGTLYPPDERHNLPSGAQIPVKMTRGSSDASKPAQLAASAASRQRGLPG